MLPRIHKDSTDTSEYHIGGAGVSAIGYGSNPNESMTTVPHQYLNNQHAKQ